MAGWWSGTPCWPPTRPLAAVVGLNPYGGLTFDQAFNKHGVYWLPSRILRDPSLLRLHRGSTLQRLGFGVPEVIAISPGAEAAGDTARVVGWRSWWYTQSGGTESNYAVPCVWTSTPGPSGSGAPGNRSDLPRSITPWSPGDPPTHFEQLAPNYGLNSYGESGLFLLGGIEDGGAVAGKLVADANGNTVPVVWRYQGVQMIVEQLPRRRLGLHAEQHRREMPNGALAVCGDNFWIQDSVGTWQERGNVEPFKSHDSTAINLSGQAIGGHGLGLISNGKITAISSLTNPSSQFLNGLDVN